MSETVKIKYPRTYHLPWSEGVSDDDKVIETLELFKGKRVIVSEKMDGENCTMYSDYIHARSIDERYHPSRDWVKRFWSNIRSDIPNGWRVCGENLYAKHSVHYENLPSYFLRFSIWNEQNECLSWDETVEWFSLLGIVSVPVLFDGIFDENTIKAIWENMDKDKNEGYVVRLAETIKYDEFKSKFAKYVRKNHVQTNKHWSEGSFEPNGLL